MKDIFTLKQRQLIEFLQQHKGEDYTSKAISRELGDSVRSISGRALGLVKRGFLEYAEVLTPDGRPLKVIRLTEQGETVDPAGQIEE